MAKNVEVRLAILMNTLMESGLFRAPQNQMLMEINNADPFATDKQIAVYLAKLKAKAECAEKPKKPKKVKVKIEKDKPSKKQK